MKILIAVDGSEYSTIAVEEIAKRHFTMKTEVLIVTAYESVPTMLASVESINIYQKYYDDADRYAKKAAEDATKNAEKILQNKNPTLAVRSVIVEGSAKHVILDEAEKFSANLIVVGSHGYRAFERFLIGSVSQSVALHAKCSVLIVRK